MVDDTIVIIGLIAFALVLWAIPDRSPGRGERGVSAFDHVPYAAFVGILAFSPLLSVLFVDMIGREIDVGAVLPFMIIIAASALPVSVLVAKILGPDIARFYINWIERIFKLKMQQIAVVWTVAFGAFGLVCVLLYST